MIPESVSAALSNAGWQRVGGMVDDTGLSMTMIADGGGEEKKESAQDCKEQVFRQPSCRWRSVVRAQQLATSHRERARLAQRMPYPVDASDLIAL